MYPPFYPHDLRVDSNPSVPFEEKRVIRRSQPESLRLILPPPGAPFLTYAPTRPPDPVRNNGGSGFLRFLRQLRFAPHA